MTFNKKNKYYFDSDFILRNVPRGFVCTLLLLLFSCIYSTEINAQRGGSNSGGRPQGTGQPQGPIQFADDEEPDTSKIYHFFAGNPSKEYLVLDTLLDNYLHQYHPSRRQEFDQASLGYMGSPTHQLIYQPRFHQGFEIGFHQYDLYKIRSKDLRFYNLEKPYTDFYFSQGGAQDDLQLKAKFGQDFAKGTKLSIDYNRISQFGGTNPISYLYENQKARHTNLAIGLAFKNQYESYQSYFAFSSNTHQQNDNGGIQSETFFLEQTAGLESNLNIPVWLTGAETRHDEKELTYTQYFILGKKKKKKKKNDNSPNTNPVDSLLSHSTDSLAIIQKDSLLNIPPDSLLKISPDSSSNISQDSLLSIPQDSLGKDLPPQKKQTQERLQNPNNPKLANARPPNSRPPLPYSPPPVIEDTGRKFTLAHIISYKTGKYKFSALPPDTASAYWNDLLVDTRGLRHYLKTKQLENSFNLSTFKKRKDKESNKISQNDLLEIGIKHTLTTTYEEAEDSTINNLFLQGKWNFNPSEKLKVETYAHFGLWDNAGDYRISGDFFFDLKQLGQLQLSAVNQLYKPNLLQQRFYISKRQAWQNDFSRTVETSLAATYAYPKINFKASGQYQLLNNFIYYDTLVNPQQFNGAISVLQLTLFQDVRVGQFHLDNVVTFQTSTDVVLRLPNFYSKHSLYYKGKWFKKVMDIRIGLDLRMNNSYFATTYNPLIGQFHLQDENEINFYPSVDIVTSMKVKRFRFFFKIENATAWLKPIDDKYYQIANYPMLDSGIRFGLAWRFTD